MGSTSLQELRKADQRMYRLHISLKIEKGRDHKSCIGSTPLQELRKADQQNV